MMAAVAALIALLAAAICSVVDLGIDVTALVTGAQNAAAFVARMVPLDFPPAVETISLMAQTLSIVTVATVLSVVLGLPLALAAASITASHRWSRSASRSVIMVMRAIPDLVMALFFFRVFGLGALPGILAMGLHSIGMVGKLYADAIEDLDHGPMEALRTAGASRRQQIVSGILPLLLPQLIATALHRFDINLRGSVLLGYVGVGGLGMAMADALNTMDYQRGMALALIMLALCIVVEMISAATRTALLGRTPDRRRGLLGPLDRLADGWVTQPVATHEPQHVRSGRIRTAPPWDAERIRRTLAVTVTAVIIALAVLRSDVNPASLLTGLTHIDATLGLFWPPSAGGSWDVLVDAMMVTIQIGLAATLIGVVIALPVGSLAARNVAPNAATANIFRLIIVVVRALPELILAIILIVMMGLGPVPGAVALGLGSVGLLGKLIADSIEETDVRVQDALHATGAARVQVHVAATLRQVLPTLVAHVLYQLDVNIRSATLLGIVGAGGIGYYLLNASRVQQFQTVTLILLMILALVLLLEMLSAWIRRVVS
ncbi:phosphonate ABC transporter, permease protein PhnE [Mycolicibacterium mengxianglii]|uniref:phosphonate ABC transporter, permease protein PhnE n=1 Tax=Mycolicibacterium mengxianglii TaxID=2736649 RepID=UPI001E3B8361|nr:phosphonate ABC transporter, permease protein PhnE [Mycolicibacterium mengxianglii]